MLNIKSANTNITVKAIAKTEKEPTLKTHLSYDTIHITKLQLKCHKIYLS